MQNSKCTINLWPITTFLFVLLFKNYLIGYQDLIMLNLVTDSLLVFVLIFLSIKRTSKLSRYLQTAAATTLILLNWMDVCIYLALHERLTLSNFISNYQNYDLIYYFISTWIVFFTLAVAFIALVMRKRTLTLPYLRFSISLLVFQISYILFASFMWLHSQSATPYASEATNLINNSFIANSITQETMNYVNQKDKALIKKIQDYFSGTAWTTTSSFSTNKPNLIIVLSESLSSVDSNYSGGLFNRLPMIDKIMADGLVLTQAVSNGKITVHGLAAFLLGIQTTVTGVNSMLEQYPPHRFYENNLITFAKKEGYKTILISPVQPPKFLDMIPWFKALGFEEIYDIDSPVFKNSPRYTWNAPSDEAMYQFAASLTSHLKQPYLLIIETVSLHQSYILPKPEYRLGNNPLLNQINYVDKTTYDFYKTMKEMGFLKTGVFVLFGDHRRFEPLEKEEINSGGYARWHERIVCTIVGNNIPSHWVSQLPFSLVDMNLLLHYIVKGLPVDKKTLLRATLGKQLNINTPFSVSLVDHNQGTYLLRSEHHRPLYISIYGSIPFAKIPEKVYEAVTTYLIQNDLHVRSKLKQLNP